MTHYAILGGGRLARHMSRYLELLEIPHSRWARDRHSTFNSHTAADAAERLAATLEPASHALLLVSDGAISGLVRHYPALRAKTLVHCSGSLSFPGIAGAHPLMTFSHELYTLTEYSQVPFMVDNGHDFGELLPGLPNPHFSIAIEDKPRYHALCVMAGNFTQVLWRAVSERFGAMGLPAQSLGPYLGQVTSNFLSHPDSALTGPLSRGDHATVQRNLTALEGDALQAVYEGFVELYQAENASRQAATWTQEAAS